MFSKNLRCLPENLEDVIRAYEMVYEVKERRCQKKDFIEEIFGYVNKGIEALEKEERTMYA